MPSYSDIVKAFANTGLLVRGGFPDDAATTVLIGQAGGSAWGAFSEGRRDEADPMDAWTERMIRPIASALGARPVFPNDRPYAPFQQWAIRAEPVHPSPLGLLIYPDYGLWHAYRAALVFEEPIDGLPARSERPSPCASCWNSPVWQPVRPVLSQERVTSSKTAQTTCARNKNQTACRLAAARDACPVGTEHRYGGSQIRFTWRHSPKRAGFEQNRGASAKIRNQLQPERLAFFRVELRARDVVPSDQAVIAAIVRRGNDVGPVWRKVKGVDKIRVRPSPPKGIPQAGHAGALISGIPTHVRDLNGRAGWQEP